MVSMLYDVILLRDNVKIARSRLHFLLFSIFRTLRLGLEVIGHTVTSVTSDGMVTTLIMELEKRVEG